MKLPGWTREPLVHFLAAGTLVFLLFAARGGEVDPASRVIEVDRETQAQIALGFERLMSRAPTDAELDAQIDRYVREEVLYREALRLGLDQDDAIVRRRLAQKMDMLASARAETEQPSEETLRKYHSDNPEKFARDARYSFDQLWFSSEDAAKSARGRIAGASDWQALGERISLPVKLEDEPRREVLDNFGERFVEEIEGLSAGIEWSQPIPSGFGWHLVRLRQKNTGEIPPFKEVRGDAESMWRSATIADRRKRGYEILREAYRVEIDR